MTDARPPLQRNGFEYKYIPINRSVMEKILQHPDDKSAITHLYLGCGFDGKDIVDISFEDTEHGIVAIVKLKRGYEQIGKFITSHCTSKVISFDVERFSANHHLSIKCQDCGTTFNVDKDSL